MLILTLPREATLKSWVIKYVGNAIVSLYEHLVSYPKDEDNYARYTSIVQSSGMGSPGRLTSFQKHICMCLWRYVRSRKVNFFVSPLVQALILKPGFPAADENVRDWFLQSRTSYKLM